MKGEEWVVESYKDEQGRSPIRQFLESLDERAQDDIAATIEYVRVHNVHAREPHVKKIEGKLWEMRVRSSKNAYRVLYFATSGRRIVLLHGFVKKTNKTPREEIKTAQARMVDYSKRNNR